MIKRTLLALFIISIAMKPILSKSLDQVIESDSVPEPSTFNQDFIKSVDSLITIYLNKEEPIQGCVISVVSANTVIMAKGYGLSNIEANQYFDPSETNVIVASVSKVITATAILQLIEQGKIQLDQPVSELIPDIQIENPFEQAVLIRHILTHTAGFDDFSIGKEARGLEQLESLKDHLKKRLPPVVWEPGKYYNYSNLGMALLAYVVESVSNMSFDNYLGKNVYRPLDMNRSGFSYTDESTKNMMVRYKWKENENNQIYLDDSYGMKYTNQIGAGGFQTTADDMANFMQMYLNNGYFNDSQVLKSTTIQDAFNPHFYYHALMDRKQGWTWRVRNQNGHWYNYHAGDDTGIESIIVIVPDADIAFFFASNNNEASSLKFEIRDLLLDGINRNNKLPKKFPEKFVSNTDLKGLTGDYQYMNDGQSSIDRLFGYLFSSVSNVKLEGGHIVINGHKYNEMDKHLFQPEEDGLLVKFLIDKHGAHYSTGYSTYRKLSFFENPGLHIKLLLSSFFILLSGIIGWAIKYRKTHRENIQLFITRLIFSLSAFFILLLFILLATTTQGSTSKYGVPPIFNMYFTFPLIGIVLFVIGLVRVPQVFRSSISWFNRLYFGLFIIAIVTSLLIYNFYNLIGYHF